MTRNRIIQGTLLLALVAASGSAGYWVAKRGPLPAPDGAPRPVVERQALYWYDPMKPDQHFPAPGKSPYMDMDLMPKYADEAGVATGVAIDPAVAQNLGIREAPVVRGKLDDALSATATLQFNNRLVAVVQARTSGFVERTHKRAPGDIVARGAPLVDILVPDWAGAQQEFLALMGTGDATLIDAGRDRLNLLGMPSELVALVEQTKALHPVVTVRAPFAGVIETLDVREGMTVSSGTTLVRLKGLETVWLEAAVPEAQAADVKVGEAVWATFTAYPGETFKGHVVAVLPEMNDDARTLRARVELPNHNGRLKPGMYATFHGTVPSRTPTLLVPSEAVIRSGTRNVVLLVLQGGRYQPVEVKLGREAGGKVAVLQGLAEGQQVVVSGQFLIDSEASLQGVMTRGGQP